jgi:hypothetical protein
MAILFSFNSMVKAQEYQWINSNEPLNNPTNEKEINPINQNEININRINKNKLIISLYPLLLSLSL